MTMAQPPDGEKRAPGGAACRRFEELESELLGGELAPPLAAELQAHAVACASCQTRFAFLRTLLDDLRQLPHEVQARRVWGRIERRLDRECERLESELSPALRAWHEAPLRARAGRVWSRLERDTRARGASRARETWQGVGVLVSVAGGLLLLWRAGNDFALDLASRAFGGQWTESIASLSASWGGAFFLPGVFALFAGLVALASLPLLLRAAGNDTSGGRTSGSGLPGRTVHWQRWAGDTT